MRIHTSLEWTLNSPPKPHAFASLPLQSRLYCYIVALMPCIAVLLNTIPAKFILYHFKDALDCGELTSSTFMVLGLIGIAL